MNIIGFELTVGRFGWNNFFKEDKIEIVKETDKTYKLKNNSSTIFDCLTNMPKDRVGIIQTEDRYVTSITKKIWILEDEKYNREETINRLKQSMKEEIEKRKELINGFIKDLESI